MALPIQSQYDKRGYLKARWARRWRAWRSRGESDEDRLRNILELEGEIQALTDSGLTAAAAELRRQVAEGERDLDDAVIPAFAMVREASRRETGLFHYPEQVLGGLALVRGGIAEMATGEGKTLTVTLAAYAFALEGKGVHVATVNDYLAARDCEFVTPILERLGMTVGLLPEREPAPVKRRAYEKDVTYGTGYEFGFDYLRDQLALLACPHPGTREKLRDALMESQSPRPDVAQRGQPFAIIDEIDSVLIDEAGSPLVISEGMAGDEENRQAYDLAREVARELEEETDFEIHQTRQSIELTPLGKEKIYRVDGIPWNLLKRPWDRYVVNALRAEHLIHRDSQYVVDAEDRIVIIDEFTGRRHEERSWRDGLHQALESKEGVPIRRENDTAAGITRQRYFRRYETICGLTGTAAESAGEFWRFFELPVVPVPLHRPARRELHPQRAFRDAESRDRAVLEEVRRRQAAGQPVLVGTRTIKVSESLSARFEEAGIVHRVLTAKQDEEESEIVAGAGEAGKVLIATNMAGRGTHIDLSEEARRAGGLHVLAVERNESARIDRQLIGRCARQGQPGSAQFFVSADDHLVERYAPEIGRRLRKMAARETGEIGGDAGRLFDEIQARVERLRYEQRLTMAVRDRWTEATRRSLA